MTLETWRSKPWVPECTMDCPCPSAAEKTCRTCGFFGPVARRRRQLLHYPGLRPRPDGTMGIVLKERCEK